MARGEKEDVSDLNLPEPQDVQKLYFGKHAEVSSETKEAFAYVGTVENSASHYILYDRGEIIDPYNDRFTRSSSTTRRFKKVSETCFNFYMKYLKTRNTLHFTRARRLVMEK
tara:strand:+ start:152 stop:487 length:336 start_codon:yes stop_codon:yes gene_type:complete